jgi:NADH-quinone oxidoreductase subunit M
MLPLYPLHGVYVVSLTRLPGYFPACVAVLLPAAGFYGLVNLLHDLPPDLLGGIRLLALLGALYGTLKALAQNRVAHVLSYGSLAFYSILWWYLAMTSNITPGAVVYAAACAMATGGLLLAWDRVRVRYGDLSLSQIGGLARPMPRFAMLLALLVMAAAGLPFFGLFSGYMAMLFDPMIGVSFGSSMGLTIVVLTWFTASWYLFKLMQQLLWGPHRSDLQYEDLSHAEAAPLVIVLALLLAIGILPDELVKFAGANTLMALNP